MNTTTKKITKQSFENIPIAIAAISLGFMSISTALVEFNILWVRHLAVIFSAVCIGLIFIKCILYREKVMNELKNPMVGSIYPTIFMSLMVISVYIIQFNQQIGRYLWLVSIIGHFLVSLIFAKSILKKFKLVDMIPSWFIPTVGIGIGAVTSKPMDMPLIANVVFCYSLVLFIALSPIMIYRIMFKGSLEGPKKQTLMIMTAPANICLAGYISISSNPNKIIMSVLVVLAYISIVTSYVLLPKLIKAKALPAIAPLTFPLAIGVIAAQRYAKYLNLQGSNLENIVRNFIYIQVVVAIIVIVYAVYKTIALLFKKDRKLKTAV